MSIKDFIDSLQPADESGPVIAEGNKIYLNHDGERQLLVTVHKTAMADTDEDVAALTRSYGLMLRVMIDTAEGVISDDGEELVADLVGSIARRH